MITFNVVRCGNGATSLPPTIADSDVALFQRPQGFTYFLMCATASAPYVCGPTSAP